MRVANHLVDGFDPCDPVTGKPTVYEFHGCLWHGCARCFPLNRDSHPIFHADRTLEEVYEATLQKHVLLRQCSYDVKIKWECDWGREVKTNSDLALFLQTWNSSNRLIPETPSSADAPTLSNSITPLTRPRERRSSTST